MLFIAHFIITFHKFAFEPLFFLYGPSPVALIKAKVASSILEAQSLSFCSKHSQHPMCQKVHGKATTTGWLALQWALKQQTHMLALLCLFIMSCWLERLHSSSTWKESTQKKFEVCSILFQRTGHRMMVLSSFQLQYRRFQLSGFKKISLTSYIIEQLGEFYKGTSYPDKWWASNHKVEAG